MPWVEVSLAETSTPRLSLEAERPVVNRRHRLTYSYPASDAGQTVTHISLPPADARTDSPAIGASRGCDLRAKAT